MFKLIFTIELFLIFLKMLDFVYLFQIKEYRFDRFFSMLQEEGIFNIFYFRRLRLPAKSSRNILVIGSVLLVLFSCIFFIHITILTLLIFIFFIPLFSFFLSLCGVFLTGLISLVARKRIIQTAKEKVARSNVIFIGITGSYGKTTTKEFLYQILKTAFKVGKTPENMNSEVGVALAILKDLKEDTEFFIAEIGAYKKGEIKAVCNYIKPKYGILTAIGNQHFDLFGSSENLREAKAELLESLPPDGHAYINRSIEHLQFFIEKTKSKITLFSVNQPANIQAVNIHTSGQKTTCEAHVQGNRLLLKLPFIGKHYLMNLLPCIALALDLNIPTKTIENTVAELKEPNKRLNFQKGIHNALILNDSYNSNVDGFIAAMETANYFKKKKTVIASRGIIELGKEKTASYKKILEELRKTQLKLYTTDKFFKDFDSTNQVYLFKNETMLLTQIKQEANHDYLLVIEGKFHPETLKQLL